MGELVLYANGVLSFLGVIALIWHMNEHWATLGRQKNQVWCMCLLGYAILVAAASVENVAEGTPLETHHFGSFIMSVALIAAVIGSIVRYRHSPEAQGNEGHRG